MAPVLDHLVFDVRDRMAEGAARLAALGFQLTPMGKHSLGSANHLAVFGDDYLELLGTDVPGGALRPDIASYPVGLNGLVFKTGDAEALSARAACAPASRRCRRSPSTARSTCRMAARDDARFRTVRLDRAAAFDGRVYWCEHLTPQHVWRPEWQAHPNGAAAVARVLLSVRDPERQAAMFRRMFGEAAVAAGADGRVLLPCGPVTVEVAPHALVAAELGAAAPDPAGTRRPHGAGRAAGGRPGGDRGAAAGQRRRRGAAPGRAAGGGRAGAERGGRLPRLSHRRRGEPCNRLNLLPPARNESHPSDVSSRVAPAGPSLARESTGWIWTRSRSRWWWSGRAPAPGRSLSHGGAVGIAASRKQPRRETTGREAVFDIADFEAIAIFAGLRPRPKRLG